MQFFYSPKTIVQLILIFSSFSSFGQLRTVYFEGNAQGTTYHITYQDAAARDFQIEVDSILRDFDNSLSTYQANSIISRINSGEKGVKVDDYFKTCFVKGKELYKITGGTFDPTVYPLVNAWGFGPKKKQTISKELIDSILQIVGMSKIKLQGDYVIKKDERVSLDFNAYAQGYSVDVIADYLSSKGIENYLVEIGGELVAKGMRMNSDPWLIGIEQPTDNINSENPIQTVLKIEGRGVATSGNYRKFFIENGVKYAHSIDPKTGYPAMSNLLSATVIAKDALSADALATALMVMGTEKAKKFVAKHKEIDVQLIYSNNKGEFEFFTTKGFDALVK